MGKVDSGGTFTYKRDGVSVTDPVINDAAASYTPGVSERRSGTSKFYHGERQGSNVLETNSSQTATATKAYDAFGMLISSSGSSSSPFGFVGQQGYQSDSDSGLMLLGHRYYDSSTGRFLTRDNLKDGRNWYAYCSNNPVRSIDPTGNWDWSKIGHFLLEHVIIEVFVGVVIVGPIYCLAHVVRKMPDEEWQGHIYGKPKPLPLPDPGPIDSRSNQEKEYKTIFPDNAGVEPGDIVHQPFSNDPSPGPPRP